MNEQFRQTLLQLKIAQNHFDFAEPDYFEAANAELTAAKYKLSAVILDAKKCMGKAKMVLYD